MRKEEERRMEDRKAYQQHLEDIKRPSVEKRNFFRGNRHGGIWLE
jgi:hypothetical protein